jgi:hypothetical protein
MGFSGSHLPHAAWRERAREDVMRKSQRLGGWKWNGILGNLFFFLGLSGIVQEEWLGWELGRAVYTTPTDFIISYHIIHRQ